MKNPCRVALIVVQEVDTCSRMIIRPETTEDTEAIFSLTTEAFKSKSYSDGSESVIIKKLRSDGDLKLSLVTVDQSEIVGHVAFSPVTINNVNDHWFGLGPISVLPELQRIGIGTRLINEGIRLLKEQEAKGIVLIGDPDYYSKFGFAGDGSITYGELPTRLVQWISITGDIPHGELKYCQAFES